MNLGPQNVKVNYTPANATSPNNVQWTVLPPSYNTRTDRFACVQGFINYYFDITLTAKAAGVVDITADLWSFGSDGGVSAFPLHLEWRCSEESVSARIGCRKFDVSNSGRPNIGQANSQPPKIAIRYVENIG
ncbi:MAG: hypothetical protein P4L35_18760, partial [Ignavibacteriaceae bacterium]|nr:hypothetical protein [Ignavibacteriaceae bacterium]